MKSILVCVFTVAVAGVVSGKPHIDTDYVVDGTKGIGYKVMYQAQPWEKARESCALEGAKLAVPRSEEEFLFIQKLVRGMSFNQAISSDYKLLVWLGISNLDDYTMWKTVDGENIRPTAFSQWAGNNGEEYSDSPAEPHCVGMDAHNPGLRDFWCWRHQPFVCQIEV